ncbi:hypothetical protein OIU77_002588 [Salix suchowensis]|uniref:Uncharacterized protein n=1 Tax=Salix suchowensis TaxID=1278906 RepID=A0ABQ9AWS9_9ROSI|nr:hypothetical protein OIU77_002588 [Salix suchowensis]
MPSSLLYPCPPRSHADFFFHLFITFPLCFISNLIRVFCFFPFIQFLIFSFSCIIIFLPDQFCFLKKIISPLKLEFFFFNNNNNYYYGARIPKEKARRQQQLRGTNTPILCVNNCGFLEAPALIISALNVTKNSF